MKIYDISMEIRNGMPVYKDKPEKRPQIIMTRTLKDGANESRITIDSHTGTHADSYFHMLEKGKTIENIPLEKFHGDCIVMDFTKAKNNAITANDLKNNPGFKKIRNNGIILLKTRNKPMEKFDCNFTYLEKSAAKLLSSKKIKLVGIDNLGIERSQPNHETHSILFSKSIPIVEGLELSSIKPGRYIFIGFPLKIKKGDASPIRAVLVK